MKKRLYILFLSLFSVSEVTSAQEVFNKVMESAQHILNEPTSTFTNTQIAKFKVDELNYMKGKAMEKDSVAAIDLLDVQSYYMSEFLSMFYTEIIYSTDSFHQAFGEAMQAYVEGSASKEDTISTIEQKYQEIDGASN